MQRKPSIVYVGFHVETKPVAKPLPPRPRVIHQQAMSSIPAGPANSLICCRRSDGPHCAAMLTAPTVGIAISIISARSRVSEDDFRVETAGLS